MILVAGATGNLGREAVKHLTRQSTSEFAILARDPAKAEPFARQGIEVRIGDYDRPESLAQAFEGIDKLLFISTMAMNRAEQQKRVVDVAAEAGIRHIVYTGLAIRDIETSGVRDLMISHFETEEHIKDSSLAYTFLRNTMYAEALPIIIGSALNEGVIALSGGSGRAPYASRADMGEAAANVLLQPGHEGRTYQITGQEGWSYGAIAEALSNQRGRQFRYYDLKPDAYKGFLTSLGLPDFAIYLTLGTIEDIKDGQYDIASDDLTKLLGRPPTVLPMLLKKLFPTN